MFVEVAVLIRSTCPHTAEGLEVIRAAAQHAPPDIHAQIRATANAALEHLVADPRRGQLLLSSYAFGVLQRARLNSARGFQHSLGDDQRIARAGRSRRTGYRHDFLCFGQRCVMKLIAGWLRGDFGTSREHFADVLAGLLLAAADVSTGLSKSSGSRAL